MPHNLRYFCPVCNTEPAGVNYYKREIKPFGIIVEDSKGLDICKVSKKPLTVIQIACRTCHTILSTIGNEEDFEASILKN